MKKTIIFFFLLIINNLHSQIDTTFTISTYRNYYYISTENFIRLSTLINSNSKEFKHKYKENIITLLDSIQMDNTSKADSVFIQKTKNKILKGRQINKNNRKRIMVYAFQFLTEKDSFDFYNRSSIEIDNFIDTNSNLNHIYASNYFIENIIPYKYFGFFNIVLASPETTFIIKNLNVKLESLNYEVKDSNFSEKYNSEINKRLKRILNFLDNNYILIIVKKTI